MFGQFTQLPLLLLSQRSLRKRTRQTHRILHSNQQETSASSTTDSQTASANTTSNSADTDSATTTSTTKLTTANFETTTSSTDLTTSQATATTTGKAITANGLSAGDVKVTDSQENNVTGNENTDSSLTYIVTYPNWLIPDDEDVENGDTIEFTIPDNVEIKGAGLKT